MAIVTLTTDIGYNDYISGAVKGQLLTADPSLNIVDITHTLSPFNYQQAAYVCANAFKHFPEKTFHIIIINLFETYPHHVLIAKHNDQYIACPDNGILTMIAGKKPEEVVALPLETNDAVATLQCTQAWANVVVQVNKGVKLNKIGFEIDIDEKYPLRPTMGTDWMEGQIIFIDNFENVVVNIMQPEFEEQRKDRSFKIIFLRNETISSLSNNYASVNAGEKLAWFNSAGYLEIAINRGNMAGLFGLQGVAETSQQGAALQNKWFYQTVRIFFE
jgi:S-adenosylmethionine hydrolase